jgi:parvulin-like peptidyl-prolyl isomerase
MTNTHRFRAAVAALGLLAAPAIVGAEIIEQILVKVNGEIFTKTDLESRQVRELRQKGLQVDPKNGLSDAQLRQALDSVTPQIMVDAVSEMILVQRAKELGYKLSDEQFKSVVDNIRKEYKLDTDEKLQAALKQENMTMDDLRRQTERSILVQRVRQVEVMSKLSTTDDEARKYYEAHLNEFTSPASVTLREILVAVPNDGKAFNAGRDDAAKAKAEQLRARAAGGENFMKLAEDSSDAPSKTNAGLLGPISLADLSADLRKIVEPMKSGEMTQAIRTPRGYQVFKVESITSAQTMPFEQAADQIKDHVATGKSRDEFEKYLTKLRSQAIIQWMNPDIHKAYDDGLEEESKQAKQAAR